uniref:Glycosyl transferase family 1 n=1 Tax=uncultured Chloroflexota bacterium TaxID=166587 RepID=H5SDX6_9CHLR|nr:glycosyl transferase family 1 [uncultured Chloroflexota bacterium]
MKVAQAMLQEGHELLLLGFAPLAEFAGGDLCRFYGLEIAPQVHTFEAPRRLFPYLAFWKALGWRPDLIYTWAPQVAVLGLLVGKPVVLEAHLLPSGLVGPLWYRLFALLPGKKRLASVTQALYRLLQERHHLHMDSEVVIAPNGVDLERFADLPSPSQSRARLALPEKMTVLCSGHLYAGRGAALFLELAARFPAVHFLWVGGRSRELEYWRTRVAAQKLENVTFYGFVPNEQLPLFLAAADILLMPYEQKIGISSGDIDSSEIASPMKMFEYMAAGRPILASDLPVLREVLDEKTAVFCPPNEAGSWEKALEQLLADAMLRSRLGEEAKWRARAYTWRERARRILQGSETWAKQALTNTF